uniref:Uncharacterized protein n=1 Tax=Ulva expansa TaxID=2293988 RepID=A0A3G2WBH1_9CHLO|nr:hypothetical protein [Ulva expansa]AYO97754.1 hypothetical protein [Ulva expansa]AYP41032.1 hypothetical protein [Ulva expansa]
MSYKQSILTNCSSVKKQKLQSIAAPEVYKDVNKHYKAIHFSLVGNPLKNNVNNRIVTRYIRPFRIIVLQFNTPESWESGYSVDVSCFFNKPAKTAILKHSKKIAISKQFARWVEPYVTLKKTPGLGGFWDIHGIVGSDIVINEYELYTDLKFQNIVLTKRHISSIAAQTLCKTRHSNGVCHLSYSQHSGVMGAFILKNRSSTNLHNRTTIYYISDYELKQCLLTQFANKQVVELSKWKSPDNARLCNQATVKFAHLLGNTLTRSEQIRSSLLGSLTSNSLVSNLELIISVSILNRFKNPLYKLVRLIAYLQPLVLRKQKAYAHQKDVHTSRIE